MSEWRRSHSRINQEEVNQTHQTENQVEIHSSDQSDNGKLKVDSRERKLSRVEAGTKTVPEEQSTVIKVLGGSVNQIQRYHLRINSPLK